VNAPLTEPVADKPRLSFFRRALWHLNRTQVKWLMKTLVSAVRYQDKLARRAAAKANVVDEGPGARAKELRKNGYSMITDLVDAPLLHELQRISLERVRRAGELSKSQLMKHKSFWIRLLDEDLSNGAFDCDSIFVRFALQRNVVGLLTSYLGELPQLTDVLLTYSTPSDDALAYSQLWHRDYDDVRTLKVFAYLTDVTDVADGPFTYLPGSHSDKVGFTLRSHLSDAKFFERAPRDGVEQVRAPRFSVFLCETSRCYHMGSRVAPGHSRLMYTATFISSPSVYPAGPARFRASRALSADERLLLGL
jgi:hypothetical protein